MINFEQFLFILLLFVAGNIGASPIYRVIDLGNESRTSGINNVGQVVGTFLDNNNFKGLLWDNGVSSQISALTQTSGINNLGNVVGYRQGVGFRDALASLWNNRGLTQLGILPGHKRSFAFDLNDKNQVVGWNDSQSGTHTAFVWENGTMTPLSHLPGSSGRSHARDINNNGQIVGESTPQNGNYRAVMWEQGNIKEIGFLKGSHNFSAANAINEYGQIVGFSGILSGVFDAFLWENDSMLYLGDLPGGKVRNVHEIT